MSIVWVSFIVFAVVYFSMPLFKKLAMELGVLDLPGKRKIHNKAVPLLGGLAIYLGLIFGFLLKLRDFYAFYPVIISATLILIVGLVDDIRKLSAQFRIVCQFLAASYIIYSGIRISFLPHTFWGDIGEIIITLTWIIGVTNAYNYLDGMDGLASGSAVVNALCFSVILYTTKQFFLAYFCLILAAACLGFLPHNFKREKIFLGDGGSTLLGFLLANIALVGYWAQDSIVKISIPVLILGVPIFDMIFTTIMRIKEEKVKTVIQWLKYGGKDHFHHCLVDIGLNPHGAVIFIYLVTFSLGISAIMVSNDRAIEAFLSLSQASIMFGVIATLIVVGKRRRSGWRSEEKEKLP
ncbi:MAG: MraY family glycosyltransferase [Candidatus Omnitrophica bacterium]|nr:MraY family glycosyltransferase [Candidatus Omnitrophota bacterium]